MASPKIETVVLYDPTTGAPISGQAGLMSFTVYVNDQATSVSAPTITEIGSTGVYKFTPVFANAARGIVYVLNTGPNASPGSVSRYMRPEDWNTDNSDVLSSTLATASSLSTVSGSIAALQTICQTLSDVELGKLVVQTSGPDANRLILYKPDGTTVIGKWDLKDANGNPTTTDPFSRTPV